jgi:hypothetical protein
VDERGKGEVFTFGVAASRLSVATVLFRGEARVVISNDDCGGNATAVVLLDEVLLVSIAVGANDFVSWPLAEVGASVAESDVAPSARTTGVAAAAITRSHNKMR